MLDGGRAGRLVPDAGVAAGGVGPAVHQTQPLLRGTTPVALADFLNYTELRDTNVRS